MGTTGALGMAAEVNEGNVSLVSALTWHLQSNHFPPIPVQMVAVAQKAIELANGLGDLESVWDVEIPLPDDIEARDGRTFITVAEAVEAFHLDSFLEDNGDW